MHALTQFVREQLEAREWSQADLVREAGMSPMHVAQLLTDRRDRLPRPVEPETVRALSRGLGVREGVLWVVVLAAVGVTELEAPAGPGLRGVSDAALLAEVQRRMNPTKT